MVPKFRAWDKNNNEMISWRYLLNGYNLRNVFMRPEMCGLVLMQSTGLKDKNGVEIFEGDVVEWLGHRGVVEFVLNNQQTMIIGAPGYITDLDYSTDFNTEVIGNIHENPKILGQANEY